MFGFATWRLVNDPFAFAEKLEKELNMTCKFTKPFRLEDGCTYETRDGKKLTAIEQPNGMFKGAEGDIFMGFYSPGGSFHMSGTEHNWDLIRKIDPPPAPLECWRNTTKKGGWIDYDSKELAEIEALSNSREVARVAVHLREVVK
jgi:hypothetical protein